MYEIFVRLLEEREITVADVSKATGISQAALSTWKKRGNILSTALLTKIADFFGVSIDYMLGKDYEQESGSGKKYYFDDATAEMAQSLFERSGMRLLFDIAKDSKPEDLKLAADLLARLKETNADG